MKSYFCWRWPLHEDTMKAELLEQKASLIAYLASKLKAGDWHAVQDAASDIREIDAKLSVLAEMDAVDKSLVHVHDWTYRAEWDKYFCPCGASERNVLPSELAKPDPASLRRIG